LPQHRSAPIQLVARRWSAVEDDAKRRAVVDQQFLHRAGRHAIAEAGTRGGVVRRAPQRGGQAREQHERAQRQRQRANKRERARAQIRQPLRARGFERAQGGEQDDQRGAQQHGNPHALVEQQGTHQHEGGKTDRRARVATVVGFQQLEYEHGAGQRAARLTPEQVAVVEDDQYRKQQHERQLDPRRQALCAAPALHPAQCDQGQNRRGNQPRQAQHVRQHGHEYRRRGEAELHIGQRRRGFHGAAPGASASARRQA
jgi:hypothetical protein